MAVAAAGGVGVTVDGERRLHVRRRGTGPEVVLVHGSVSDAAMTWAEQQPLERDWTLIYVDRPGYGEAAAPDVREDFALDAPLVAAALGDGAHLVGHSYGGVVALLAAAERPQAVQSLTLVEPAAFDVARRHPAVAALIEQRRELLATGPQDPEAYMREFARQVGVAAPPSPLSPSGLRGVRLARAARPAWEATIPLRLLRAARTPTLVVSGDHSRAYDAVCSTLVEALDAESATIPGAGHDAQKTGEPFNAALAAFLRSASSAG
ncbi:MAG: alpha/beta hydrolase [Actinobacteria bacterium]|nr:alpha/beta hydrolase [Actinomycetota bacterium]